MVGIPKLLPASLLLCKVFLFEIGEAERPTGLPHGYRWLLSLPLWLWDLGMNCGARTRGVVHEGFEGPEPQDAMLSTHSGPAPPAFAL